MTQITCRDLTIGYGSRIILKHLNFTVNEGDYLCIIGENGSGKSSLMRTILNLQNPINGQILYDHQIQQNGFRTQICSSLRILLRYSTTGSVGLKHR